MAKSSKAKRSAGMNVRVEEKRRGNCYNTACALYHLLGGKDAGWTPHTVTHEGDTHWYLARYRYVQVNGKTEAFLQEVLDPTVSQFKTPPDYSKGRGRGFLTKGPSKKARELMEIMVWQ